MFSPEAFIEEAIEALRKAISGKAIIAVSGGVDSATAAVLASQALGKGLLAVYVDTGLMRKGERQDVEVTLRNLDVNYEVLEAADRFFAALKGVEEPETKRKVIGNTFVHLFEGEAQRIGAEWLIQGTIAPDWIESGGQLRDRIKAHHNVAGLPTSMTLEVVEPLRDLYKDEVRRVARALGVEVAERQPFPGPGLGVRVLGEVTPDRIAVVREACAITEEEIEKASEAGLMERPWQYFAVLLPVRSVGVEGDVRVYGHTVVVRAVASTDGMTASYSPIPPNVLGRISTRITNEVRGVNRVAYDVTNKPPGTIEWE
ncbi:MAG: glutamine-hydrolyzing GMP synthase [Thermoplasmata archaeon]